MGSGPRQSSAGWSPAQQAGRIVEVDLAQDRLGQPDAVDLPAALNWGGAVDLAVQRLEVAPGLREETDFVRAGGRVGAGRAVHHVLLVGSDAGVGPEQDAILVLREEASHLFLRLAADLGDARRRVDEESGVAVEHAADVVGILGVVAEVDGDEGGLGVAGDPPLERVVELLPGGDAARVERPLGVGLQLVPALVVGGGRLPERLRIAAVDRHRHAELAGALEHRVEAGIVDGQQVNPVCGRVAEAEPLGDLEADGAEAVSLGQLIGHGDAVVGRTAAHQLEIGRGEDGDAATALGGRRQLPLERVVRRPRVHPRQVHHAVDSPLIHQAHGVLDAVGGDVRVDVDAVEAVPGARGPVVCASVAADHENRERGETPAEPRRRSLRPQRRHHGESGLISLMYGPPVSSGWAFSFGGPAAGVAAGAAGVRRSLAFTFSVCGLFPCGRDQSRPLTIRSLGSNPSFLMVIVCGDDGSTSLLTKGVLPSSLPSISTWAPDGDEVIFRIGAAGVGAVAAGLSAGPPSAAFSGAGGSAAGFSAGAFSAAGFSAAGFSAALEAAAPGVAAAASALWWRGRCFPACSSFPGAALEGVGFLSSVAAFSVAAFSVAAFSVAAFSAAAFSWAPGRCGDVAATGAAPPAPSGAAGAVGTCAAGAGAAIGSGGSTVGVGAAAVGAAAVGKMRSLRCSLIAAPAAAPRTSSTTRTLLKPRRRFSVG